jgi:hypothetical protein
MTKPVSVKHARGLVSDPYLNKAFNKISWGAILAGVALVTQLLLNPLGAGIEAADIDPRVMIIRAQRRSLLVLPYGSS